MVRANKEETRLKSALASLPVDILFDILTRVSAHDLILLKTTCKQWKNIINCREFSKAHLKRWEYKLHIILLLGLQCVPTSYDIRANTYHQLYLKKYLKEERVDVLDSLDGLVLFKGNQIGDEICLCNPVTQRFKSLFRVPQVWNSYKLLKMYKLVFDNALQKYKVMGFCFTDNEHVIDSRYFVLTLGDDDVRPLIWRKLETRCLHHLLQGFVSVVVSGRLYWIGHTREEKDFNDKKAYIQPIDIASEEFEDGIQLPCQPEYIFAANIGLSPMETKGWLCVAIPQSSTQLGIWVVKDLDNRSNWEKLYNFCSINPKPHHFHGFFETAFRILLVMDEDYYDQDSNKTKNLVVELWGHLYYYRLTKRSQECQVLEFTHFAEGHHPTCTYVPSLISWDSSS